MGNNYTNIYKTCERIEHNKYHDIYLYYNTAINS
jgi:hypothetical protein